MTQARGFLSKLKLAFEDTFNTIPTEVLDEDVTAISNTAGDTWKFTCGDDPTLTGLVGRTVAISGATNAANDGHFVITAIDNTGGAKYFEITNAAGVAEVASPATFTIYSQFESMPFNESGMGSDENLIDPTTITGNRYQVEPARGNISVQGTVTVPVDVRSMGTWLKAFFGAPNTSGVGPYAHVFVPSNDTPSVALESSFPDIDASLMHTGCKINNWNMRFVVNEELKADLEIMGCNETTSEEAVSYDDNPSTRTFSRFNAKDIVLSIDGAPSTICQEISLTMSNELAQDQYTLTSDGFRASLPETALMVSGTMKVFFENLTIYNKAINSTELALIITATSGANIFKIELQEVVLPRQAPSRSGPGPIALELPFKAYYQNGAAGVPVKVTLTNDVSSYA